MKKDRRFDFDVFRWNKKDIKVKNRLKARKSLREKFPNTELFLVEHLRYLWSYFWSLFSCIRAEYGDLLRGPYFPVFGLNTDIYSVKSVFSPNTEKYGPEITPYLDTFHAVRNWKINDFHNKFHRKLWTYVFAFELKSEAFNFFPVIHVLQDLIAFKIVSSFAY